MSAYTARLKKMTPQVKAQMEDYTPGGAFAVHPEGTFNFRVQASLEETKKEPIRMMVSWIFTNAGDEYEGRKAYERTIIEDNKVGLHICRNHIEDLGLSWPEENFAKIEDVLDVINSAPPLVSIDVGIKKKDGYENNTFKFLELLADDGSALPTEETASEEFTESESESEPETDPNQTKLITLCKSFEVKDIDDSMSISEISAKLKMKKIQFPEEQLQPEEIELLKEVGPSLIEKKKTTPAKRTLSKK
jgi:hypothetical protein